MRIKYIVALIVFVSVFQKCCSQWWPNVPERCKSLPLNFTIHSMDCCRMPQFFHDKDYIECGLKRNRDYNIHKLYERKAIPIDSQVCKTYPEMTDVKKIECLFDRNNIGNENDYGIIPRLRDHFRKLSVRHPRLQSAVTQAIRHCFENWKCPCTLEFKNFAQRCLHCFTRELLSNCQTWKHNVKCHLLLDHINDCKGWNANILFRWGSKKHAWGDEFGVPLKPLEVFKPSF